MKKPKLHILFLSSWFPSRVHETNGIFVLRHAEAVALSNQVTVLFFIGDKSLQKNKFEIEESEEKNVKIIRVYFHNKWSKLPLISHFQKIKTYFKAFQLGLEKVKKIDLVHGNVLFPVGIFALYLKIIKNIPFVFTEHWTGYHPPLNQNIPFLEKKITQLISKKCSFILPVTQHLANSMQNFGLKGNYKIVPNVVDCDLFHPIEKNNFIFQIIHISYLKDEHKNVSGILRAIKKLTEMKLNFHFTIVGDGDLKPHLKYAKKLEIPEKNLSFHGEKTPAEIAKLIQLSDLFVLFSNYENLPCVILEAMACGIPTISTDVGGISEHLKNEYGILIPAKNENALMQAILKIQQNPRIFASKKLRNYAIKHFSKEQINLNFNQIYRKVLSDF